MLDKGERVAKEERLIDLSGLTDSVGLGMIGCVVKYCQRRCSAMK